MVRYAITIAILLQDPTRRENDWARVKNKNQFNN